MNDRQTDEWLKMRRDLHYAQKEIQNLRKRLEAVKKQLLKEIHKAPHTWDDAVQVWWDDAVQVVQEFEESSDE